MRILITLIFLQKIAFGNEILIAKDTTISGTWTIPDTTILKFTGGKITGTGSVSGGVIDAPYSFWIFDTTLTSVNPSSVKGAYFSAMWFGAKTNRADNTTYLQRCIDVCKGQKFTLYIPKGTFIYKRSLLIQEIYQGNYVGIGIHITGESNYWDAGTGSILKFLPDGTTGAALALQQNKGTEIDHITLQGGWVSPDAGAIGDSVYSNLTLAQYTDQSGSGYNSDSYRGLVIDYNTNFNGSVSGSSGCSFHDMQIRGFGWLIGMSKNGVTLNADALNFYNISLGDAKQAINSYQGQEKGNVFRNLYCWSNVHTLFTSGIDGNGQGGEYTIDVANIAGGVIRVFNVNQTGWNGIHVSNMFCEQIVTIGTVYSDVPIQFDNCTFDFRYPNQVKIDRVLLTTKTSNPTVIFNSCKFRYFGYPQYVLKFYGQAQYNNCYWSGDVSNQTPNGIYKARPGSKFIIK